MIHLVAVEFSGRIGLETLVTSAIALVGATALFFKWRQGDPSEWRENYLGEVARRQELEAELGHAQVQVAKLEAQKSLEPVLEALERTAGLQDRAADGLDKVFERLAAHNGSFQHMRDAMAEMVEQARLQTQGLQTLTGFMVAHTEPAPKPAPRRRKPPI